MRGRNLATAALLCAVAATGWAQQQKPPETQPRVERRPAVQLPLEPIERYTAVLPASRNRAISGATVVFRHWLIANDQQVEIPHRGFLLVHVHAGEILVTIGDRHEERHGDEFFTVQPGERLIVETARDSVVLRTIDTIERGP